jgi:hypothetical protein
MATKEKRLNVLEQVFALAITGHEGTRAYQVTVLRPDPAVARAAYRLQRPGGDAYDVAVFATGPECSCPDFIFRSHASREGCKHISALRSLARALAPILPRPRRKAIRAVRGG